MTDVETPPEPEPETLEQAIAQARANALKSANTLLEYLASVGDKP